jgi:predicted transcriptional regulator
MFDVEKTERLAIRVDTQLRDEVRRLAELEDRSWSSMARRLLERGVRDEHERLEVR